MTKLVKEDRLTETSGANTESLKIERWNVIPQPGKTKPFRSKSGTSLSVTWNLDGDKPDRKMVSDLMRELCKRLGCEDLAPPKVIPSEDEEEAVAEKAA